MSAANGHGPVPIIQPGPLPTMMRVAKHFTPDGVMVQIICNTPGGEAHYFLPEQNAREIAQGMLQLLSGITLPTPAPASPRYTPPGR